jgi:hypothetical protein
MASELVAVDIHFLYFYISLGSKNFPEALSRESRAADVGPIFDIAL